MSDKLGTERKGHNDFHAAGISLSAAVLEFFVDGRVIRDVYVLAAMKAGLRSEHAMLRTGQFAPCSGCRFL